MRFQWHSEEAGCFTHGTADSHFGGTLPDEARYGGALESDFPFFLASSVAHLCCTLTFARGQHHVCRSIGEGHASERSVGCLDLHEHAPGGDNE